MRIAHGLNAVWIAALLGGCATLGPATVPDPLQLPAEARDPEFRLVISSPRERWAANEPIEVSATLSYLGPQARTIMEVPAQDRSPSVCMSSAGRGT